MTFVAPTRWPSVARWNWALRAQLVLLGAMWPWLLVVEWWLILTGLVLLVLGTTTGTFFVLRDARKALNQRVDHALGGFVSWAEIEADPELSARLAAMGIHCPAERKF